MSEHTALPWFVDYYCPATGKHTIGPEGFVDGIAETRPSPLIKDGGKANAEYIVHACNAHEANEKRLMAYAKAVDRMGYIEGCGAELLKLERELEAIKKAEVQP